MLIPKPTLRVAVGAAAVAGPGGLLLGGGVEGQPLTTVLGRTPVPWASSWSAPRTTSATTRPSTRAAGDQGRLPRPRGPDRRERPRGRHRRDDHGADDRQGRQADLCDQYGHLDAASRSPRSTRTSSSSRATRSRPTCRATPARTSARSTNRCTSPESRPGRRPSPTRLGYVYAFPIPQTIASINAFERGAQSVNPDVETITVSTSSWCDPGKQRAAAESLLSQGVDVPHPAPGLHLDRHPGRRGGGRYDRGLPRRRVLDRPKGWLTGAVWDWGPLYTDIVETVVSGDFVGSPYNDNFRVGYKTGTNPFVLAGFGPGITDETKPRSRRPRWLATEEAHLRRSRTRTARSSSRTVVPTTPRTTPWTSSSRRRRQPGPVGGSS